MMAEGIASGPVIDGLFIGHFFDREGQTSPRRGSYADRLGEVISYDQATMDGATVFHR